MNTKKKEPFTPDGRKRCLTSIKQAIEEIGEMIEAIGEPFRPIDEERYLTLQARIVRNANILKVSEETKLASSYAYLIRSTISVIGDNIEAFDLFNETPSWLRSTQSKLKAIGVANHLLTFYLETVEHAVAEYCLYTETSI